MYVVDSAYHEHISRYFHRLCDEVIRSNFEVFGGIPAYCALAKERFADCKYESDRIAEMLRIIVEYGLTEKLIERLYHS